MAALASKLDRFRVLRLAGIFWPDVFAQDRPIGPDA